MRRFKQSLIVLMMWFAALTATAAELTGDYCWVQLDFRTVLASETGEVKLDAYYPSLYDAIKAAIDAEKTDFTKEAVNNGKTDILFLRDPIKGGKLRGKILITSDIACKWRRNSALQRAR